MFRPIPKKVVRLMPISWSTFSMNEPTFPIQMACVRMGRPTLKNGNDIVNVDACKIGDRYQLTLTLAKRQPGIIRGRVSLLGYCFLCLFWKTVVVRSKMSLQSGTAKKKQLTATAKPFYATAPLTHAIMIVNQLSISL
jgi:hypothetical protein